MATFKQVVHKPNLKKLELLLAPTFLPLSSGGIMCRIN